MGIRKQTFLLDTLYQENLFLGLKSGNNIMLYIFSGNVLSIIVM